VDETGEKKDRGKRYPRTQASQYGMVTHMTSLSGPGKPSL
jgi:hypothetical protein